MSNGEVMDRYDRTMALIYAIEHGARIAMYDDKGWLEPNEPMTDDAAELLYDLARELRERIVSPPEVPTCADEGPCQETIRQFPSGTATVPTVVHEKPRKRR